jgi:hypothetical protein
MKLRYCCDWPNPWLFLDENGGPTAVVHCSACQTIQGEIYLANGKPTPVFQEEEE